MRREELSVNELTLGVGIKNASGMITLKNGTAVPASAGAGYAVGAIFNLTNAALGQPLQWINIGSTSSCLFVPTGIAVGGSFVIASGPVDSDTGSTTKIVAQGDVISTDLAIVGHAISDDNDQVQAICSSAKGSILITGSADPLTAHDYVYAAIRDKCEAGWDIVAAGTHTTVGGAAAEAITVTGALAGDIAFAVYGATNDTDTIRQAVVTADTLTVTCDADPAAVHSIHYVVLRPRGSFKPSHYIAYSGSHTTVGGDATEVITITGALATDIPIVTWQVSNDADTILKAVLTANTLTCTLSANPSTAHALAYMILREY